MVNPRAYSILTFGQVGTNGENNHELEVCCWVYHIHGVILKLDAEEQAQSMRPVAPWSRGFGIHCDTAKVDSYPLVDKQKTMEHHHF